MSVGLVIVSHSRKVAEGVVELAAQMAPDVTLVPAGGTTDDDGTELIGTSLDRVMEALAAADTGSGTVILADLGSAVMTAESALEFLGDPETTLIADAPLVEGSIAAAVAAQSGGTVQAVRRAAEEANRQPPTADPGSGSASSTGPAVTADVTLINPMGLHTRPAAALAGALGGMDADIEINGMDGKSVMMLMALGAGMGKTLSVSATGAQAEEAVALVRREVERGFGEI
jgi:phosphoenolpyruvate---glycerone phosphotransferase subunit DhaM